MRVFIGIELDNDVKEYMYQVQNFLKPSIVKGELTNYNNFHLTIKYIGHVMEDEIDILKDCIDLACDNVKPFHMKLNGLHSFNKGKRSILWVGIESGKKQLDDVYKNVDQELISAEFDIELNKKYRPHITVGKKMIMNQFTPREVFPHYYDTVLVSAITLFHSHRVNDVLTYTPIYRCILT